MRTYKMEINGEKFEGKVVEYDGINVKIEINGIIYQVKMEPEFAGMVEHFERPRKVLTIPPTLSGKGSGTFTPPGQVTAPLPGIIVDVLVKEGDKVSAGDVIAILEAMKMESEIATSVPGIVKQVKTSKGESVLEGQVLVEIEAGQ
jgi:biotin carboxyl carrier protein